MTVRDPMSLPNPFKAAGSNIPLPALTLRALTNQEPSGIVLQTVIKSSEISNGIRRSVP
jgi:hypothetical protein